MSYSLVDVAIVGAGIAGLAAARRAAELGLSCLVLEAKDRIGGRVHTATRGDGRVWDMGAHWLRQPPVNRLIAEADRIGATYDRQWRPIGRAWQDGEWLTEALADDVLHQIDEAEGLAIDLTHVEGDSAFVEMLDPEYARRPLAEAVIAFQHAASPRDISAVDLGHYSPFEGDWAVTHGFSTLLHRLFRDVAVELNSPVRVIDWGSDPIRVDFGLGLVEANRVLVTASMGVLGDGRIQFAPDLPDMVLAAVTSIRMGSQNKVSFVVESLELDQEPGSLLHTMGDGLPITFYRPTETDLVVAILSGPVAAELEQDDDDGLESAALHRFGEVFGSSIMAKASGAEATSWGFDPYTAGAASVALPGLASSREVLRAGLDGRILFAGEATSFASFGTAHGAFASGIDVIEDIAESLGLAVQRSSDVDVFQVYLD